MLLHMHGKKSKIPIFYTVFLVTFVVNATWLDILEIFMLFLLFLH